MTVTSRKYFTDWFVANGVTKDWGFDFTILSQADVVVQVRDGVDNTSIVEHTTDLAFFPLESFTAGTVRYPVVAAALPVGKQIRLVRRQAYLQLEEIGNEGRFNPQTIEKAFDRVTINTQQVDDGLERSVKVQIGGTAPELTAGIPDGAVLMKQGAFIIEGPNAGSINTAQGFAEAAEQARDEARLWANEDEDVPVEGADYSAKHWSAKSAGFATAAGVSAGAADDAKIAAELALTNIDTELMHSRMPVGTVFDYLGTVAPNGSLALNGQQVTTLYPDLRAMIVALGSPWGTSGGHPLLPDLITTGYFRRAGGPGGRTVGSLELDQMQGHEHDLKYGNAPGVTNKFLLALAVQSGSGAGAITNGQTNTPGGNTLGVAGAVTDGVNGTPRVGNETRPRSMAVLPCVKAFGTVDPDGMADLSELLTAIATQAEAEAGVNNTKIMTPLSTRQACAAYNKYENIEEVTLAAAASYIKTGLSAFYELVLDGYLIPSANASINMQVSLDNGGSWQGTGDHTYQYVAVNSSSGTPSATTVNTSTGLPVTLGGTAVAAEVYQILCHLAGFNKAQRLKGLLDASGIVVGPSAVTFAAGLWTPDTVAGKTARNALRLIPSTGTLSGKFTLAGKRG